MTMIGQYDPMVKLDDQPFIDGLDPVVEILPSKQFPRKLVIRSYDKDFTFLLKGRQPRYLAGANDTEWLKARLMSLGNEDLRGDERIMQLYKLINTMLNHKHEAFSRNLHLLPYEVVPLSPSAGLLSWVSNTQTSVFCTKIDSGCDDL